MVDRNRNGIDDAREGIRGGGVRGYVPRTAPKVNNRPQAQPQIADPSKAIGDFFGWITGASKPDNRSVVGASTRKPRPGGGGSWGPTGGLGKGIDAVSESIRRVREVGAGNRGNGMDGSDDMESWLQKAMGLVDAYAGDGGVGGGPARVSYDPLRNDARKQWSEQDAKAKAMYDQLQGSIRSEGGNLAAGYDTSINQTGATTSAALDNITKSAQSLTDMKTQQAAALGIGEQVGNALKQGTDITSDSAQAASNVTQQGKITQDLLTGNKAAGLDFNNDLVGAAGLAGGQERSRLSAELGKILASLDVEERNANADAEAQWASAASQGQADRTEMVFDLARQMQGTHRDDFALQSENQRYATSEANEYQKFLADMAYKNRPREEEDGPLDIRSATALVNQVFGIKKGGAVGPKQEEQYRRAIMQAMGY